MLPESPEDQQRVALAMGFANYEALLMELDDHRQTVEGHFDNVFGAPETDRRAPDTDWTQADAYAGELAKLGFGATASLCERLAAIHTGTRYQQLSEQARERFDAIVPRAVGAAAGVFVLLSHRVRLSGGWASRLSDGAVAVNEAGAETVVRLSGTAISTTYNLGALKEVGATFAPAAQTVRILFIGE
jgi:hypothetical protein